MEKMTIKEFSQVLKRIIDKTVLKSIGSPYDGAFLNDGSFNVPTVDESCYWDYVAGIHSLRDASWTFFLCGWTRYVDDDFTRKKFAALNEKYGKLSTSLRPKQKIRYKSKDDLTAQIQRIYHNHGNHRLYNLALTLTLKYNYNMSKSKVNDLIFREYRDCHFQSSGAIIPGKETFADKLLELSGLIKYPKCIYNVNTH